jgi:membrane-associated phospholipid phosphatase
VKTESQITAKIWMLVATLALASGVLALFFDARAAIWINIYSPAYLKHAAEVASRIGDWPAHVAVGLLGAAVACLGQRRDWVRIFLAMLIACALAGIAARVIKIGTGRARPLVKTESTWSGPRLDPKYNAFPSGHTASSTAFFVALFLARKKIGVPFLFIPIVIAAARVIAGAHYLSDVTFATALGVTCALLTSKAMGCQPRLTS